MPIPFETELVSASFNDTYRNLIEQYKEQKAANDAQELHLTALDGEIVRVDERIDDTNATLENEIARVDGRIDTEIADRTQGDNDLNARIDTEVETINGKIDEEKTLRETGDTALDTRIDEEQARADEVFQTKNIPPVTVASVDYTTVESAISAIANSQSSGGVTHDELNGAIASVNTRIDTEIATLDGKIDTEVATLDGKIDTEIATINGRIDAEVATIDANKQSKTLENPVPIPLGTQTDVEETLHALNLQEQIDTSNLSQSIAPEFIETASYNVGDYVMSQGVLFKCRAAHTGAWSDADFELVKIVNEMGGGTPSPALYDYVITSQAEFDDWVANHNDGTETVAIKQGNYTFNGTLRTKNVNGDNFNYAILQPKQMDGYGDVMISVSAAVAVAMLVGIAGEKNKNKTKNIQINVEVVGGSGRGYGLAYCDNLTDCSGSGSGGSGGGYGYGLASCNNLTNCSGSGSGSGRGYGFVYCDNLTNCSGSGDSSGSDYGNGYGFFSCTNLTDCSGSGSGSGGGYGFGFASCTLVLKCKPSAHCTTSVFNDSDCSFSPTYQAQYKCDNTLEGGWNDTTNPA